MNTVVADERLLTEPDLARLTKLGSGRLPPELEEALEAHDTVAPDAVPADLVTLHAEVRIRDLASNRIQQIKLCEPDVSNPALGCVSVLSPLGAALLGLREGMVARWPLPLGGGREALVEKVLFAPAAAPPREDGAMDIALLADASAPSRAAARRAASVARATQGRLRHVARAPGPVRPWLDACAGADLIVTAAGEDGWCDVLVGSAAERIARLARRPVLLVRQAPRGPYRRALVPVDFSPWSADAVALARRVAPHAALVLMHALDPLGAGKMRNAGVAPALVARYRDAAEREAQARLRELAARAAPERPQVIVAEGAAPWRLIVQAAEAQSCDLVVIGKQGRNALDELLLGSTTRSVIAESRIDILLSATPAG